MNHNEQHTTTLETVQELVTALKEEERTTYTEIIQSLELPASALEPFASWSEECYTRNCIVDTEKFELILICWEKEQFTPIHGHNGEECWVKVIQGEFKETIYQLDEKEELQTIRTSISAEGDSSYMIDFMGFHRLENSANERSMSLHLYAKPIRSCRLFDEDLKKFVRKEMTYTTTSEMRANLK